MTTSFGSATASIAHISQVPINRRGGQTSYLLLPPGGFGSLHLAATWVEGDPGSEQPVHTHPNSEQIYFICHGSGVMRLGDATYEVEAGSLVFIAPGVPHAIRNNENETLVFVTGRRTCV